MPETTLSRRQWGIVFLIAAVQFINILDFVMVMPLGPDFAHALGIDESLLGYVGGAYTAAACLSGLAGSLFLDRFDRRKALAVAMLGLVAGTAAGGLAFDLPTLLLARVLAGAFGGPATSLSLSIIADSIPAHLRGRAMGTVMGAFSLASVLGVPAGLWFAEHFGWRSPFLATAALGLVVCGAAIFMLPPMTGHLERAAGQPPPRSMELLRDGLVLNSYTMTAVVMMAGFIIIPNIASYAQLNLGFPREQLKWGYGLGGVASLLATQSGGRLVDRFGSFRVAVFASVCQATLLYAAFYLQHPSLPVTAVLGVFVGFMTFNGLRNVAYNTLTIRVPPPALRARFTSMQSAVQHGASALAAFGSSVLLSTVGDGESRRLTGMPLVALTSIALTALVPLLILQVERGVRGRAALQEAAP